MRNWLTKIKNKKFIIFIIIGGFNTLFGYGIFALFLLIFNLHYTFALFLSTIIGILFNFKTIGIFVFKNSNNKLIFKFILVYGICYLVNLFFIIYFSSL